jgi:hypothetical protein
MFSLSAGAALAVVDLLAAAALVGIYRSQAPIFLLVLLPSAWPLAVLLAVQQPSLPTGTMDYLPLLAHTYHPVAVVEQ